MSICLCVQVEDEMLQCCVCEDWFHSRVSLSTQQLATPTSRVNHALCYLQHLGGHTPSSYEEIVCDRCMKLRPFLQAYMLPPLVRVGKEEEEVKEGGVSVEGEEEGGVSVEGEGEEGAKSESGKDGGCEGEKSGGCELERRRRVGGAVGKEGEEGRGGAGFFAAGWRELLCTCDSCKVGHGLSSPVPSLLPLCLSPDFTSIYNIYHVSLCPVCCLNIL